MTSIELVTMFSCAYVWEGVGAKLVSKKPLATLVVVIAISQGTGSVALAYVNYPVKVAFKSCKLVPTMLFSQLVTGARYSTTEYVAAVFMSLSLMVLGLADADNGSRAKAQTVGFFLLAVAVCSDALIPNIQEKLLRQLKVPVGAMVVWSNFGSFVLIIFFIAATGELRSAVDYCRAHRGTATLLFLQALSAYCGLRCYLNLVRNVSGVAGVLATSARKVLTLILSFVLFTKPFTHLHGLALLLLAAGVALAVIAKHRAAAAKKTVVVLGGHNPLPTTALAPPTTTILRT
ncbi:hypothetical protein CTAYLR_001128 [Chrysophaeum taylorii]|uniref:Uncharacterized protein n=1 Tax=Chrysophaeum taylorii TaxID=2483200 RepID=A0AAD7XNL1_9STRA|nr:hypothetical protein CTAYLR_001128 [Chrysophaeum taylorii]